MINTYAKLASITVLSVFFALIFTANANAHAILQKVEPSDDSIVKVVPKEFVLQFNENISVAFGGTRVWGPDGERVDNGKATTSGGTLRIPIKVKERGTYALSYRIISADGHPVRGASVFHLRKATTAAKSVGKAEEAASGDRKVEISFGVARGIALLALIVVGGGVFFATVIAPGVAPRFVAQAVPIAIISLIASFILDAMNATGLELTQIAQREVIRAELDTAWGRSATVQLGLLIFVVLWHRFVDIREVRSIGWGVAVGIPALLPLVAWSFGGHALVGDPVWLRLSLDIIHMIAAAIWIGGLIQLFHYLDGWAVAVEHVERFSRFAFYSVVVLVITGIYAAWSEVGMSLDAVSDTTYGRLVAVKVLLLILVMPLAWVNKRKNVPNLRVRRAEDARTMRKSLRFYVVGELLILVFVIAATVALIQTPPARTETGGIIDAQFEFASGASAQLVVDPAKAGSNELHVYAMDKTQRLDGSVTSVKLTADGPNGIKNFEFRLLNAGIGHYYTPSRTIPFAGDWKFTVVVDRGRFESETASTTGKVSE